MPFFLIKFFTPNSFIIESIPLWPAEPRSFEILIFPRGKSISSCTMIKLVAGSFLPRPTSPAGGQLVDKDFTDFPELFIKVSGRARITFFLSKIPFEMRALDFFSNLKF